MEKQIAWIKEVVKLCLREFETEQEKRDCFLSMEKVYCEFTAEEQKKIRNIMMEQFETRDMLYLLSAMVRHMDVKEFREDLMECLLKVDYDCFVSAMLEYQATIYVTGEYKRKRMLRKKNREKFDEVVAMQFPYIPVEKRNQNRIVVVTGQIIGRLHAPSKIVMNILYVLQECFGYEVLFFICPCDRKVPDEVWYNPGYENSNSQFAHNAIGIQFHDTVLRGYQINMGEWCGKEYNMMFDMVYAWNPLFVLDCSTTNPVVEKFGDFTTLVSLPMSFECPVSEAKILIRGEKNEEAVEQEYLKMIGKEQVQLFIKERLPVIADERQNLYTRAMLGLPEDEFLIAVVGNRLAIEIGKEFVQVMKNILEKTTDVSFAIIGNSERLEGYFTDKIFDKHVYYLGYCQDLMGVYHVLDLYLNPKRQGGGFSGGMALMAGLPVVTLPDCDVAHNCGKEFVVSDYKGMVDTICSYVNNRDFYGKQCKNVQKYREENNSEKVIRYVQELLEGVANIIRGEN